MRRNKQMQISTTFLLLCRVLVVAAYKTCKAASRGATRLHDWSLQFRKTLSHHRRGSGATHRRSNHYCLYSIISLPFSLEFKLRHPQHPQRWRGSGRPPWCWRDTFGTWLSLPTTWDTMIVPGTSNSMKRSTESLIRVHSRICTRN